MITIEPEEINYQLRDCLKDIQGLHEKQDVPDSPGIPAWCSECGRDWPCHTYRMVASVL